MRPSAQTATSAVLAHLRFGRKHSRGFDRAQRLRCVAAGLRPSPVAWARRIRCCGGAGTLWLLLALALVAVALWLGLRHSKRESRTGGEPSSAPIARPAAPLEPPAHNEPATTPAAPAAVPRRPRPQPSGAQPDFATEPDLDAKLPAPDPVVDAAAPFAADAVEPSIAALDPTTDVLNGTVDPATDARFVRVPQRYTIKTEYLQKPAAAAVQRLIDAAHAAGIDLQLLSGFRSLASQQRIWDHKWQNVSPPAVIDSAAAKASNTATAPIATPGLAPGKTLMDAQRVAKILRYSSLPGTSRHHWGSDVDFNTVLLSYWRSPKGQATLQWLRAHASDYGFCEVYAGLAQGKRTGGHRDEPWHWSYLPLARTMLQARLASLDRALTLQDAASAGAQPAQAPRPQIALDDLRFYIESIAPQCR